MLGDLSAALSSEDAALYTTIVHGLKNNARGIGADSAADVCFEAERTARTGDIAGLQAIHGKVCDSLSAAAKAAERLVKENAAQTV